MSRTSNHNWYINNVIEKEDGEASSFLSIEKDTEAIIKKLFVDNVKYATKLKKLLIINAPDCLTYTTNETYDAKLKSETLSAMLSDGYINLTPKATMDEHQEVMSYIIISFDNFTPSSYNPYYRDCTIMIDIICHVDYWSIGDGYKQRPIQLAGYIDAILNGSHLSGLGTLQFMGANELVLSKDLAGYTLMYAATHGVDDAIPPEDEDDE